MIHKKLVATILVTIGICAVGVYWLSSVSTPSQDYDEFALCLKDSGAVFYGAFWCPHCKTQKNLFGKSASKLPYVECSTPDRQGQLEACVEKEIAQYPTWIFADETRLTGEISLETLAEKTGCTLPVAEETGYAG